MSDSDRLLLLSRTDLEASGLGPQDFEAPLAEMFRAKAEGHWIQPPMMFMRRGGKRWANAMMGSVTGGRHTIGKVQLGDPDNPRRGRPQVQGIAVLFDDATGNPRAIMDSGWITSRRTVGVSMLATRHLVRPAPTDLAIIGCGLQGRLHLQALPHVCPTLRRARAYDIEADRTDDFVRWSKTVSGIEVSAARDMEAAVRDADIIVSATAIPLDRRPCIVESWLKPGSLFISLDRDAHLTDEAIRALDVFVTDDRAQFDSKRQRENSFLGVERIDVELEQLVVGSAVARKSNTDRIVAFMLGVANADLAVSAAVLAQAEARGWGQWIQFD